ncbi:Uncharacterized protein TCM_035190 [Theobroma cacao]|uniref:Uncharacterized protein n=1 Tax=Theobroma cacao TaxID=3641 RepID=A0A061FH40_THECC|nr:Uncharacterized protein TCM_035190 [Theobroma cacao]
MRAAHRKMPSMDGEETVNHVGCRSHAKRPNRRQWFIGAPVNNGCLPSSFCFSPLVLNFVKFFVLRKHLLYRYGHHKVVAKATHSH